MKRTKYVLLLFIIFILGALGIFITNSRNPIKQNDQDKNIKDTVKVNNVATDSISHQDLFSQDSVMVKNNYDIDSVKNKLIDLDIDTGSWIKNPATSMYSLRYENKLRENLYEQNQKKYASNVKMEVLVRDLISNDEEQRLNAIKIIGLIPENNQITRIENLLLNDSSFSVRIECAKSLRILKSIVSIPALIKASNVDDVQLRLEIALTLASLGEKKESIKMLNDLGQTGERNIILDTHLGYLYLATNEAVKKLKIDLSDTNSYVSVDAAIILAELGYFKDAYPVLKSKLLDSDKFIRMAALRGLAYIGNTMAIKLIRSMLNDSEQLVRSRSELILKNCQLN